MRDHEWSILDSLAHKVNPDNQTSRRQELSTRLRYAETKLIPVFKHITIVANVFIGFAGVILVLSAFVALSNATDAANIFRAVFWPLFAGILLHLASYLWRYPRFEFLVPTMLKHPDLQIFRDHLKCMADGEIEVWDKDDHMIGQEFLRSPWAVLIYSDNDEARAIPLSPRFQRYPDGLRTRRLPERLTNPLQQVEISAAPSLRIPNNAPTHDITDGTSKAPRDPHWLSTISEDEFSPLLKELSALWHGRKAAQIETMLEAAHMLAREKPQVLVADLRRAAVTSLKSKTLPIGLDGGKSNAWINRMLGWEKAHRYRFVRLHFTDPNYQLPQSLSEQRDLDL